MTIWSIEQAVRYRTRRARACEIARRVAFGTWLRRRRDQTRGAIRRSKARKYFHDSGIFRFLLNTDQCRRWKSRAARRYWHLVCYFETRTFRRLWSESLWELLLQSESMQSLSMSPNSTWTSKPSLPRIIRIRPSIVRGSADVGWRLSPPARTR